MTKPVAVKPQLPNPGLPAANWADCYQLRIAGPTLTATDAARMAIGQFPRWVDWLMAVRNAVVGLVGLKSSTFHSPSDVEMIGMFPVVSRSDREIVLGFDDRHLDFRIVIGVSRFANGEQAVSALTLVNRKILLGKIYISVITPFHKLIVATMLSNLDKRLAAVN